jgi:acetate---CoA ligase (ADP-forming)
MRQTTPPQPWERDPDTSVMLLYLESFGNPRRFARLARRIGRSKPIVAVKAGRTTAGVRAAGSHTAALAGSDVATCLEAQPLPMGRRVEEASGR